MPSIDVEKPKKKQQGRGSPDLDRRWGWPVSETLPGDFALFNAIPVEIPDWTRPQSGRLRIFESDFLERLTVVSPYTPPSIFLPVIGLLVWWAAKAGQSAVSIAGLFAAGMFFWTFFEYAMHRAVFHFTPKNRWEIVLAYFMHGIHHAYPEDDRRLVMPPTLSLTLSVPVFLLFKALLGAQYPAALAGFFLGYLCYDMTHYAVHFLPMTSKFGNMLRKHHMLHHFATPDKRFGVSSPLWDHVFGTAA